jgi:DNA-directed RNA polymerase subunit RPC12/RpoP
VTMSRRNAQRRFSLEPVPYISCVRCGRIVPCDAPGTRNRNHCPHCLYSLHVDICVGDRRSGCGGLMEPIAIWVRADGESSLIHRCERCGKVNSNRITGDDDDAMVKELARRPLIRMGGSLKER